MKVDWSQINRTHIEYACNLFDTSRCIPTHPARNTFLLHQDKRYPAKFIRGLAYELATGKSLDPNVDYEGGLETAKFIQKLEFEVEYSGKQK